MVSLLEQKEEAIWALGNIGQESPDHHTLRLWGTEFYVRTELSKSMIRGQSAG